VPSRHTRIVPPFCLLLDISSLCMNVLLQTHVSNLSPAIRLSIAHIKSPKQKIKINDDEQNIYTKRKLWFWSQSMHVIVRDMVMNSEAHGFSTILMGRQQVKVDKDVYNLFEYSLPIINFR
jgi:hypothetical protein